MYSKFQADKLKSNYDAIVIGSGLGGLTAAYLLAQAGKKILLLEKHFVPGGFTHTFKRSNYYWDVGVHYVGQVHKPESALRKVFDCVTEGRLKWNDMGTVYDKSIIAGKEFQFVCGKENQIKQLIAYFPKQENAIHEYFKAIDEVAKATPMFFGEKAMPPLLSKLLGCFLRKKFNRYSDITTYDFLKKLTDDELLIAVLCAQCGDYGLPPQKSSFAIHAIIVAHYIDGGNYPIGGAAEIYKNIIQGITKYGGDVFVIAHVQEILIENNKAVGVKMEDGTIINAPKIISNAGARNTFTKLISESHPQLIKIRADLQKVKPSISHICLYVGLNKSDAELQLPKNNYWVYKSEKLDQDFDLHLSDSKQEPALYYISFPSAKDPNWPIAKPNMATIQVVVACSYEWMTKWEASAWMKRGDEYLLFKEKAKEVLLTKLFEIVPQIQNHVTVCEVSTPLSTRHFSNYQQGEIYGLEHTPRRFRLNWLRTQSPIKNLFLTGQDTLTVGVGGAIFSGVITASVILKKNLLSKIEKQSNPNQ